MKWGETIREMGVKKHARLGPESKVDLAPGWVDGVTAELLECIGGSRRGAGADRINW
jgi:hypothetical protein